MKKLLEFICKSIVENPENVSVSKSNDQGTEVYKIKASQNDLKYLIGKQGKTINAIRTLARIKAAKLAKRVNILLDENSS